MSPTFPSQEDDIGNKKSRWCRMIVPSFFTVAVAAGNYAAIVRPNGGRTMVDASTGEGAEAVWTTSVATALTSASAVATTCVWPNRGRMILEELEGGHNGRRSDGRAYVSTSTASASAFSLSDRHRHLCRNCTAERWPNDSGDIISNKKSRWPGVVAAGGDGFRFRFRQLYSQAGGE